ncbi:MAG TPA: large conductance mechanosensitive channel protein MscL [Anaerolineaceae bacterium]|nr:large conductance mechanosensitive channel protein MscL [Anaerolineaceae bacterium]
MWKEFKEFITRGNMMDLAIGVIIGGAFGKIISSLVSDILMPVIGLILGKVDFTNLFVSLNGQKYATLADAQAAGAPTFNYGLFINNIIDFLIIALVIFMIIKALNKLSKKKPEPAPDTRECPHCLTTIAKKATRCPNCTSEVTPVE